jgi:hypothetical protein
MLQAIDIAASLGAPTIYMQTGGRGGLSWEQAADGFAELLSPCKAVATKAGITLMIENATYNGEVATEKPTRDCGTVRSSPFAWCELVSGECNYFDADDVQHASPCREGTTSACLA